MRYGSLAVLMIACQSGGDDSFPVVPGGGGPPVMNPAPDGPPADALDDGGSSVAGRVCVVADPRAPTVCAPGNAAGITVALGTSTATTAADGSFTIAAPATSNLVWTVIARGFVSTLVPLGTVHLLPIVTTERYNDLLLDNGVVLQAGQGSVFVRAVRGGAPAAGVTATVEPASLLGPLYDGGNALIWDRDATSTGGMVWIPDALAGTLSVALTATSVVTVSVPVSASAITFATVGIP